MKIKIFVSLVMVLFGITFFTFPASIILLDGRTCAGKSTTAKVLTDMLRSQGKVVKLLSIDDYILDIARENLYTQAYSPYRPFRENSPFAEGSADFICDVFNQKVVLFAVDKLNDFVVVDHCFCRESMFCCALLRFRPFKVFFVKIYCTYQKALERLKFRNSVPGDSNRLNHLVDFHFCKTERFEKRPDFHANKNYDLEIDTTEETPEQCALKIKNILNKMPGAFLGNVLDFYWIQRITSRYSEQIIKRILLI